MNLLYYDRIKPTLIIFVVLSVTLFVINLILRKKKKWKMKYFLAGETLMVGVILILCLRGYFGKRVDVDTINTKTYTKQQLEQDFDQLEKIVFQQSPLYYADKEDLKQEFADRRLQIMDAMTEEEFYRLVNPLVVGIQCGHTNLSISEALQKNRRSNARFLTLKVYVNKDQLFDQQSGEEILSINGRPADKIIETLLRNISHDGDNLAGAYYILNLCFPTKYYDFIEQPAEFVIEFKNNDGVSYTKSIQAVYDEAYNVDSWGVRMAQYANKEFYESSFSEDTAILRIRVFMKGKMSFSKFLKDFFDKVKEQKITKVIIDVRGNFGGDPRMAKELLSYLITEPFIYFNNGFSIMERLAGYDKTVQPKADQIPFDTELWIDGACFSTCGHFAAVYQSMGLGKIKGENTGGGSLCTDSSRDIVLHQTGLRLHYSTKVYKVNAECDKTNVVCPDEPGLIQ